MEEGGAGEKWKGEHGVVSSHFHLSTNPSCPQSRLGVESAPPRKPRSADTQTPAPIHFLCLPPVYSHLVHPFPWTTQAPESGYPEVGSIAQQVDSI